MPGSRPLPAAGDLAKNGRPAMGGGRWDGARPLYEVPAQLPIAPEIANPTRRMALYAALAMVFARLTIVPELLAHFTGINTFLLYILGPPALIGCLITGGMGRAFKATAAWCWTGFFLCMAMAVPFSSWPGASFTLVSAYARTDFICLFVLAGLVITWREVKTTMNVFAVSGFALLVIARIFAAPDATGRLTLNSVSDQGTLANSNDLAAQMVLILPFMLWIILQPKRNNLVRLLVSGCIFYGLWIILGTSSRGALIGLGVMAAFLFFKASGFQRFVVLAAVPILTVVFLAVLPQANIRRLGTLFASDNATQGADEAEESMTSRSYLLNQSIKFTLQNPIFGVGPSQFSNFEGKTSRAAGEHGTWHETHNAYTQISSECGVPALIFVLAGLFGSLRLVNKSYKRARGQGNKEIASVCLCYMASLTGYMATITFLACGYRYTLPLMVGLGIAIHFAERRHSEESAATSALIQGRAADRGILAGPRPLSPIGAR